MLAPRTAQDRSHFIGRQQHRPPPVQPRTVALARPRQLLANTLIYVGYHGRTTARRAGGLALQDDAWMDDLFPMAGMPHTKTRPRLGAPSAQAHGRRVKLLKLPEDIRSPP